MAMFAKRKEIRHNRVLDLRKKIKKGWTVPQLLNFCKVNLEVSSVTANSYLDEAAEPYRKQYQKEHPEI